MEPQTLSAEVRQTGGKGPARQLRMRGLIPAVYYGPGIDPVKLTVSPTEIQRALLGPYGRNQLIEVGLPTGPALALVKDVAIDPASRQLLHVDLYAVFRDRPVVTTVALEHFGRALGVQKGGVIHKLFRELPVRCLPQDVPDVIKIDVGPLDLGAVVRVSDLTLPPGVEVTFAPSRRVLAITTKEIKAEGDEEGAAPAAPAGKK